MAMSQAIAIMRRRMFGALRQRSCASFTQAVGTTCQA
jgi:hypothetical protein